jgi:hypothetical protein
LALVEVGGRVRITLVDSRNEGRTGVVRLHKDTYLSEGPLMLVEFDDHDYILRPVWENQDWYKDWQVEEVENMRDPDRIPLVLNTVREYWEKNPDLRLGQLVQNFAMVEGYDDAYPLEDSKLLDLLDERLANNG